MKISAPLFVVSLMWLFVAFACNKESDNRDHNCINVAFPDGPAYIKVINDYPQTVEVYLQAGAGFLIKEIESGHCEIFGVLAQSSEVEIKTLDLTKSRIVQTSTQEGQTITIDVGPNFF
ncbi:MAG: hypothetical protein H7246_12665 [Phycisphaerae bacterium]|nr:hypothetical protein [Saprospiraceae bacterium]